MLLWFTGDEPPRCGPCFNGCRAVCLGGWCECNDCNSPERRTHMDLAIGRIVHYTLSEHDALAIHTARNGIDRAGNPVGEGDVFPAMVVRTFGGPSTANLQLFLDGNDAYWVTSRTESGPGTPGTWAWPVITAAPDPAKV